MPQQIVQLRQRCRHGAGASPALIDYVAGVARGEPSSCRRFASVLSPRAGLALLNAARAHAQLLDGRAYCLPGGRAGGVRRRRRASPHAGRSEQRSRDQLAHKLAGCDAGTLTRVPRAHRRFGSHRCGRATLSGAAERRLPALTGSSSPRRCRSAAIGDRIYVLPTRLRPVVLGRAAGHAARRAELRQQSGAAADLPASARRAGQSVFRRSARSTASSCTHQRCAAATRGEDLNVAPALSR